MDVFLIDSSDINKHDKRNRSFRQAVSISGENLPFGNIIRQVVALAKEFVPLEYFAQTHCRGMLILLITFLRQPVTIIGELVPHQRLSQTSGVIPLIKNLLFYSRFSGCKRMLDSSYGLSFYG